MKILGQQEQWLAAAERTRQDLGLSKKTRGKVYGETGEDLPSRFWREKIFRDDDRFIDEYSERTTQPKELADLTKMFPGVPSIKSGKYERTMEHRLGLLEPNQAPFWEILNNGNIGIMTGRGVAYPIFGPTRFKQKAELVLKEIFRVSYGIYLEEAKRLLGPHGPPTPEPPVEPPKPPPPIEVRVQRAMQAAARGLLYSPEPTKRTLRREYAFTYDQQIQTYILATYEIYASGGKVFYRTRGAGGHFIKNMLGIKTGIASKY
jgi:hypothetical protein